MWASAHARQVESIGVPARHDRGFTGRMPIAVQAHGFAQMLELMSSKFVDHTVAP